MDQRILGRTGLSVSRLGLGLAALGRPGYINLGHAEDLGGAEGARTKIAMAHHAKSVLDLAWESGVHYFDVARSYGAAESLLSSWLTDQDMPPEYVTVGSKWGYVYTADWKVEAEKHEIKDHSYAMLKQQQRESKSFLRPYLKLYQIHSATLESGVLDNHDVAKELVRLRREEGINIGLSLSGPKQAETLRRALQVEASGERVFDCVQATWNLLERTAGPVLAEAHEQGLGVIVKEGLANGRLTRRNNDPSFATTRRILDEQARRLGTTMDALALAAILAQPWADVVLSGAATREQLTANLGALTVSFDEEAERELASLAEASEAYWRTRSGLVWN